MCSNFMPVATQKSPEINPITPKTKQLEPLGAFTGSRFDIWSDTGQMDNPSMATTDLNTRRNILDCELEVRIPVVAVVVSAANESLARATQADLGDAEQAQNMCTPESESSGHENDIYYYCHF